MVFHVKYDSDDQNSNLPHDVQARVDRLVELKKQGYTHIKDKWLTAYTGLALALIDDYITETKSYL